MQAWRKLSGLPGIARDQLQERQSIDIVRCFAQRKGEARRGLADPAVGVDFPQPVGLVFLEFAQQQRNDFALFRDACLGDARGQESARDIDRSKADEQQKHHDACREQELPVDQCGNHGGGPGQDRKSHRRERQCRKEKRRTGDHRRKDGPNDHQLGWCSPPAYSQRSKRPDSTQDGRSDTVRTHFGNSRAPHIGVVKLACSLAAVPERCAKRGHPCGCNDPAQCLKHYGCGKQRTCELTTHSNRAQRLHVGILQGAQACPIARFRAG